jgi:hypothetical protein
MDMHVNQTWHQGHAFHINHRIALTWITIPLLVGYDFVPINYDGPRTGHNSRFHVQHISSMNQGTLGKSRRGK